MLDLMLVMSLLIFALVMGCNDKNWERKMSDLLHGVENRIDLSITQRIRNAILSVDRDCFIDESNKDWSYNDHPIEIPQAIQATISAPHMHVYTLAYLSQFIQKGSCVLDVGSGSGYLTAVISKLIGKNGIVIGIDYQSKLIEIGQTNINQWSCMNRENSQCVDINNIYLFTVNIYDFDINQYQFENNEVCKTGFDAIHVGASANENILSKLLSMMKDGSRLIIPIKIDGGYNIYGNEHIYIIDKDKRGIVTRKKLFGVRYVPLVQSKSHNDL